MRQLLSFGIGHHGIDPVNFELFVLVEQVNQFFAELRPIGIGLQPFKALAIAGHLEGDQVLVLQTFERTENNIAWLAGAFDGGVLYRV